MTTKGAAPKAGIMTDEFFALYLDYCRTNKAPATANNFDAPAVLSFNKFIGNVPLSSVQPVNVQRWVQSMFGEYKPITIGMRIGALKTAFFYAIKLWLLEKNPVSGIQKPKSPPVGRALKDHEIARLLQFAHPTIKPVIQFALYSGMRRGEVLAIDWAWVDRRDPRLWRISLPAHLTKTRKGRIVLVHPAAQACMGAPRPSGRVFDMTVPSLCHRFRLAVYKAGFGRVRFHDLRHSFATAMLSSGASTLVVMKLGGWTDPGVLKRYEHVDDNALGDRLLALNYNLTPS